MELHNAAIDQPRWAAIGVDLCRGVLVAFPDESEGLMPIRRETIGDELLYEYARIIADARFDADDEQPDRAGDSDYWSFLINRFRRLRRGELGRSSLQKESRRAAEQSDRCAYCGGDDRLQWDHLIPLARGGPDGFDNLVRACATCNASKGASLVTVWASDNGLRLARWLRARHLKLLLDEAEAAERMGERIEHATRAAVEALLFPSLGG